VDNCNNTIRDLNDKLGSNQQIINEFQIKLTNLSD
jgi:hypothetical protein